MRGETDIALIEAVIGPLGGTGDDPLAPMGDKGGVLITAVDVAVALAPIEESGPVLIMVGVRAPLDGRGILSIAVVVMALALVTMGGRGIPIMAVVVA